MRQGGDEQEKRRSSLVKNVRRASLRREMRRASLVINEERVVESKSCERDKEGV